MSDLHDDDRGTGDEATEELTAEQLQEQLAKKEEDIQFLKGKWGEEKSKLQQEIDAIKQAQSQFQGRISEQREMMSSKKEPVKDPYEFDDDTIEDFRDHPEKIVEFFKTREEELKRGQSEIVNLVVEALKEQDNTYKSELTGLKREIDPELQAWKPAINELKQNDRLKSLDDETLIEIAKMRDMKPLMEYRGEVGGQRERQQAPKARPFDPDNPACQIAIQIAGGDRKAAENIWKRAEAKKGLK